ncbi:TauD/TfdA family dioxygenase [Embleya sp. NBC_00896]|uniref:TauD/TfdA family dioxygenase n=1 Tax=Embleya sp. NBC_00896 TaxID=2975961 RepID=UPI003868ABCC|nr:TauD/TfdA family dioxygenase [Embleya sp. NBC_00896]
MTTGLPASLRPLGAGTAALLTPEAPSVGILDTAAHLVPLLARTGYVLLRDFAPTLDDFNALVRTCSARITLDPARAFYGDAAQMVDSGHDPIGLHIENGATPYPPDLLWFHCVTAADSGSQTTVCDGQLLAEALDVETLDLFRRQRIVFSRRVPAELWRRFVAFGLDDGRSPDEIGAADLHALTGAHDVEITVHPDDSITYAHATYGAHPSRWSTEIAWANSLFGPSYNYETPDIRFEDGSPIPKDVLAEIAEVAERVTEEVLWQSGDVLLIDNSRVMHGRRAITDPRRTIVNAQSFAPAN